MSESRARSRRATPPPHPDGEASRARIETQLHEWGVDLEKLKLKVDKEIAEAKKEYYEHLEELRDEIEPHVRKWGPEGEGFKELQAKIEAELKAWSPQIHSLQVAADKAEAEAKRLIENLKAKKKAFKARLGEVKQVSDSAWGDVKTGAGKAWEELRPASRARSPGSSDPGARGAAARRSRAGQLYLRNGPSQLRCPSADVAPYVSGAQHERRRTR